MKNNTIVLRKPELADVERLFIIKNNTVINNLLGGFTIGYTKQDIQRWIEFHNGKKDEVLFLIVVPPLNNK